MYMGDELFCYLSTFYQKRGDNKAADKRHLLQLAHTALPGAWLVSMLNLGYQLRPFNFFVQSYDLRNGFRYVCIIEKLAGWDVS